MSTLPLPIAAFLAGLVSFLSPCVLPLVPGYISLISGAGVEELKTLFDKSGNPGELEVQMGVHHGFAFPQRWCYDKPAAERTGSG